MASSHNLTLFSPEGVFLDVLNDFVSIECVLSEMLIGTLTLLVPASHNQAIYRRDARIAYYRAPSTDLSAGISRLVGNTTWLVARRQRMIDRNYKELVKLTCVHPNALLARRVVAYNEKSSQADKTATAADDMIKAYVRENFTAATDTTRNWASTFFEVEADVGAAPAVDKAASYRTVLTTCQEIAAAAAAAGTYLGFEVASPAETGAFRLRTYTGQRGTDRSSGSSQPLILGVAYGSMNTIELDDNWLDMASFVYAGGSGKKSERLTGTAQNAALIAETPYGRIEWFQSAGSVDTQAVLDSEATRALRERRPRTVFTGDVSDTDYATYGEEYDWGDRVVGEYARVQLGVAGFSDVQQYDCRVDPVRITVERTEDVQTGEIVETETLDIRLRSEAT